MELDVKESLAQRNNGHSTTAAEAVMARAQAGEREAATQLIELFYERIYAFLRRLTANETEAADLTQRTFTRVWEALPTFAGRSSVGSWIHGIAYHVYVDWRRLAHRLEARPAEWWDAHAAADAGPDEEASRSDFARRIYAVVNELEPDLRDTVHLHYYQDLTLQQTADAMDVAASTVKYRLRQALADLQKKLAGENTGLKPQTNLRRIWTSANMKSKTRFGQRRDRPRLRD
jgi:RNA polymerase sigma-70 factor (ECF subfamily)